MSKWTKRKAHRLNTVMAHENANSRCDGAVLNLTCAPKQRQAAIKACAVPGVAEKLLAHVTREIIKNEAGCNRRRRRR